MALQVLRRRAALEDAGGAGEEADLVDHRRHLLARRQREAACRCSRASSVDELVGALLDGVGELQQRLLALARGGLAPRPEGARRRRRTRGRRRPRRSTGAVATTWPVDGSTTSARCVGLRVDVLAVDEVAQARACSSGAVSAGRRGGRLQLTVDGPDTVPHSRFRDRSMAETFPTLRTTDFARDCRNCVPGSKHDGHGRSDRRRTPVRQATSRRSRTPAASGSTTLSKTIIEQLQNDGRQPYATIAKAVGLSEAAVRQRVQRLLDAGVMQIVAVTDPLQLGFRRQAMIGIRVDGDLHDGRRRAHEMHEVTYVVATAGSFDLLAEVVCEDDDHLLELLTRRIRPLPGVHVDRDLRLPQAPQAALQLGNPMRHDTPLPDHRCTATGPRPAPEHDPEHDTRRARHTPMPRATTCGCTSPATRSTSPRARAASAATSRSSSAARATTSGTTRAASTSTGSPACSSSRSATAATELAEAAAKQAEELAFFPLWSYAHPRAIELAERLAALRARRPQPGLLHHRRRRGRRDRLEAGQAVLQARRASRPSTR